MICDVCLKKESCFFKCDSVSICVEFEPPYRPIWDDSRCCFFSFNVDNNGDNDVEN